MMIGSVIEVDMDVVIHRPLFPYKSDECKWASFKKDKRDTQFRQGCVDIIAVPPR
jgi:hypothetical protein